MGRTEAEIFVSKTPSGGGAETRPWLEEAEESLTHEHWVGGCVLGRQSMQVHWEAEGAVAAKLAVTSEKE